VRGEQVEQAELLIGQLDVASVGDDLAPGHVDLHAVDAHEVAIGARCQRPGGLPWTPQ
jgi:hypothetical protein